jgi:Cu(I)/Ag(I) efflux system membrane fusion protein
MDLVPATSADAGASATGLTLSPRARQLAQVETAPVERRVLQHEIRMVGKVTVDETQIRYVASYIPGRLDRLFVDYTGILVHKGDHLAEIYSPDLLVAQREYVLALEQVERSGGEAGGRVSRERSLLESARRKLELWGIPPDQIAKLEQTRQPFVQMRVDAPSEGWVLQRQGYEGMYVETGTRLFTLADLRQVWVMLEAYELDLGMLRLAQKVSFETEAYPGRVFEGTVAYLDPVLQPDTRTLKVRVNVPNPDLSLRPGMFVRARVAVHIGDKGQVIGDALAGKWICYMHPEVIKDAAGTCDVCGMDLVPAESLDFLKSDGTTGGALAIPETAVLWTGDKGVVYVESEEDGRFGYEPRFVTLGRRAGGAYVVLEGLEEGERVVTHGGIMIDSALQIQARPSMMAPGEHAEGSHTSHYVAGAAYHQAAKSMIDAYLALVEALAADEEKAAGSALENFRSALSAMTPEGLAPTGADAFRETVARLREAAPSAASIDALRESLPKLTQALEDYLQAFGHDRAEPLVEAYCPMAFNNRGASWLQVGKQIRNPYFGNRMLRCGEVRGQIAADGRISR